MVLPSPACRNRLRWKICNVIDKKGSISIAEKWKHYFQSGYSSRSLLDYRCKYNENCENFSMPYKNCRHLTHDTRPNLLVTNKE